MERIRSIEQLDALREALLRKQGAPRQTLTLCGGTGCRASGCMAVVEAFKKELERRGLSRKVILKSTGCHGFCERGPLAVVGPGNIFYQRLSPEDVPEIVEKTLLGSEVVDRLLYRDPETGDPVPRQADIPFYRLQSRVLLGQNLVIEPGSIRDYIAQGGYKALGKALTRMTPEEIIEEVTSSGLRGRGGAGFPTGRKWETCREAPGKIKYVVCNADGGDPGAYKDRSLLEGNPHKILEGMIIGAYAIGAGQGYIYVRSEYGLSVAHVSKAIADARRYGFIGEDILGTGFSFDVKITRGGGALVCGESTAVMASLEGKPPEPSARYTPSTERGLFNRPTNLNNVESWANITGIILDGAATFARVGTETGKGTKIFSLVGKVNNRGLVEVPMGTPLGEIIFGIGGGIPGGKRFKAVQACGLAGGCLPKSMLDLKVDFDELARVGSTMCLGTITVMDEEDCMVDLARHSIAFLEDESCGKCTPCREGLRRMKEILTDVCEGRGRPDAIDQLERLGRTMKTASLCGLGRTAPNPVLTTIRYFRDEYEAHIQKKQCPALACRKLVRHRAVKRK